MALAILLSIIIMILLTLGAVVILGTLLLSIIGLIKVSFFQSNS